MGGVPSTHEAPTCNRKPLSPVARPVGFVPRAGVGGRRPSVEGRVGACAQGLSARPQSCVHAIQAARHRTARP